MQGLILTLFVGILHGQSLAVAWVVSSISSAAISTALALGLPIIAPVGNATPAKIAQFCIWLTFNIPSWDNIPILSRINTIVEMIYMLPGAL